jgi:hypothetical protein
VQDLARLYAACAGRIAEQVYLVVQDERLATGAVHGAFARAGAVWDEVVVDPSPEGWVRAEALRIATGPMAKLVLAYRRRRARHHRRADDRLLHALGELSTAQATALVLHHLAGLGSPRVALEMESSVGAAETRILSAETALPPADAQDIKSRLADVAGRAQLPLRPPHEAEQLAERRTRRALGLTGGAAASVVLVLGLAMAADGSSASPSTATPGSAPVAASVTPSAAPATPPQAAAASPAPTTPVAQAAPGTVLPELGSAPDVARVPSARKDLGYVRWGFRYDDQIYVEFDRARLRSGEIANNSQRVRVFPVAANAFVEPGRQLSERLSGQPMRVEDFLRLVVSGAGAEVPMTVRYDNGEIESFEEYAPSG